MSISAPNVSASMFEKEKNMFVHIHINTKLQCLKCCKEGKKHVCACTFYHQPSTKKKQCLSIYVLSYNAQNIKACLFLSN